MLLSVSQVLSVVASLTLVVVGQTTSLDYCQALAGVISICQDSTSNFLSLTATAQASCYCGSSLGTLAWGGATFDGLASDCASQYATIDSTIASDASLLAGFCTEFAGGAQSSGSATQTSDTATSTASASPKNTLTSGAMSTGTSLPTTLTHGTTSDVSVVTVAATASSTSSSKNDGFREQPHGLRYIVHTLIMQVLVWVAYL